MTPEAPACQTHSPQMRAFLCLADSWALQVLGCRGDFGRAAWNWTGLDWTGLDCAGLGWVAMRWVGVRLDGPSALRMCTGRTPMIRVDRIVCYVIDSGYRLQCVG